jgi:hypothetical protein
MSNIHYTPRTPFNPSDNAEDVYIEQLNEVSELLGGVRNLGAYAQITGIEHTTCISTEREEQYVHIDTKKGENPGLRYKHGNDDNAWIFSFKALFSK